MKFSNLSEASPTSHAFGLAGLSTFKIQVSTMHALMIDCRQQLGMCTFVEGDGL